MLVLLVEDAQGEARFGLFQDSANLNARQVHSLYETYHISEINLDAPVGTPR